MRGVGHKPFCPPHGPGLVQVLKRWKNVVDHTLSREDDVLQSAFVLGSGYSIPDGDGGGEDKLIDGGVKVHHHCLLAD